MAVALRDDEGALGAGWFPGSMCVPPPSLHSATPPCPLLPTHRLWPPLGVVIQISKSVCFHPPFPRTSFSSSLYVRRFDLSSLRRAPLAPAPEFPWQPGGGSLHIILCVTSRLVRYARVGVGYPPPRERAREHVYKCMCVCVYVCVWVFA